eukprot:gene1133-1471_t
MVDKRGAEENGHGPDPKRTRTDGPAVKPALNLEALQKAKALLEKQKQLQEKLKKLPKVAGPGGAAAAAAPSHSTLNAVALAATANPLAPGGLPAAAAALPGAPGGVDAALIAAKAAKAVEIASKFGVQASLASVPAIASITAAAAAAGGAGPRPFLTPAVPGVGLPVRPPPLGAAAAAAAGSGPRPLRLDEQGREVDDQGNVIQPAVRAPITTSLINQRRGDESQPPEAASPEGPRDEDFIDHSMAARPANRLGGGGGHRRRRGALQFVEEGSFARQAEIMRLKQKYDAPPGDQQDRLRGSQQQQQQVEQSEEDQLRASLPGMAVPPPEVEWWDKPLLGVMQLRLGKITCYIEHPVPLEPPAAGPPPAPQPLKLTKRELKKMRTLRRQAREKEKQELIRQGLLEPPKPKVKISNLMRVLGEEATLDPTAIEQEVRRQMNERQAAHDDRNIARMLTKGERRDKKLRKLLDPGPDAGTATQVSVYRVEQLANGQHKFKVDVNAQENHMSGIMLVCPAAFSLVVVEGGPKSIKRYQKLMLRRIDWLATSSAAGLAEEDHEAEEGAAEADVSDKPLNSCHLVWQGVVGAAAFKDFIKADVATPEAAKKLLEEKGVGHYWDAAAEFDFDAAPLVELV